MRIAVDTRHLGSKGKRELSVFTGQIFYLLAALHPEHEFIFVSDHVAGEEGSATNISHLTIAPEPTNFLLYKWWFDVLLPVKLKKRSADLFIGTYALGSLTMSLPQVLIIRDLAYPGNLQGVHKNDQRYRKRSMRRMVQKAKRIVTLSRFLKEEVNRLFGVNDEHIKVVGSGVSRSCTPLSWEQREVIKDKYADGCEYFVVTGSSSGENFLAILKAFSIFKKWQKTNMKLLVTGVEHPDLDKELEKLHSYKYRAEVVVKRDLPAPQREEVIGGSYAVLFFSAYQGFADAVLEPMFCEVPLITCANTSISEIVGEAALYGDPLDPGNIAEQMKRMYKDEQLRSRLIDEGKMRRVTYNWNSTAEVLWEVIQQAVSK